MQSVGVSFQRVHLAIIIIIIRKPRWSCIVSIWHVLGASRI